MSKCLLWKKAYGYERNVAEQRVPIEFYKTVCAAVLHVLEHVQHITKIMVTNLISEVRRLRDQSSMEDI